MKTTNELESIVDKLLYAVNGLDKLLHDSDQCDGVIKHYSTCTKLLAEELRDAILNIEPEPDVDVIQYCNERNWRLVQTCGACPEQYDLFDDSKEFENYIGYFRLRHGFFYAEYCPTETRVYEVHPEGDGLFEYEERNYHLLRAVKAIEAEMKKG